MGVVKPGTVYLVGGGPGDPGLITVRGLSLLQEADVVVYDRLVDERVLRHTRPGTEVHYAGKWPRRTSNTQDEINERTIQYARQGRSVVRLKGGDPFVFGRGGEEASALREAGVPFEVVPGVTSAVAVPAYSGIPVTHRGVSASFTVVSGSEDPSKPEPQVDWSAFARSAGTLVVLMGWESLPHVIDALMANGRPPETPAALVQWGTRPEQHTVEGTLSNIMERGKKAGLAPPVVAVFGGVVGLRPRLRWFDTRPLHGLGIMVTRSRAQASTLCDLLSEEGAQAFEVPSIHIAAIDDDTQLRAAARRLGRYQWIVFTSANGVDAFWGVLEKEWLDARAFGGTRVAAIGPATASALRTRGIAADLVPNEYVSESVVEAMAGHIAKGDRVLLPRAADSRPTLVEGLERTGAVVEEVTAYRTLIAQDSQERAVELLQSNQVDLVTFTSSSTVRNLVTLLGSDKDLLQAPAIACIGPVTARSARELGLRVDVQAKEYTIPGLVAAIKEHFAGQSSLVAGHYEG